MLTRPDNSKYKYQPDGTVRTSNTDVEVDAEGVRAKLPKKNEPNYLAMSDKEFIKQYGA